MDGAKAVEIECGFVEGIRVRARWELRSSAKMIISG
jgi:hypothetical protein